MNFRAVRALVTKDLLLFSRNRFYAFITVLGLVAYIAVYFVMPGSVDEQMEIGLYAPVVPPVFENVSEEGLAIDAVESEDALREAVLEGKYAAGVVLPPDIMEKFESKQKPEVTLYFPSDASEEVKSAVEVMLKELAYMQTGQALSVEMSTEILGRDMLGQQIPPRDRMRPLFAVLILMFETMGLASLITEETEQGTGKALLVTPMSIQDLFIAKGIMGIGLAFGQAVLFMAIVGGLSSQPSIILTALLLGSILVTATGFLMASVSKDMMSAMGWGMGALIIFSVPTFGILFPGVMSGWVEVIPSYYLAEIVHQAANFNAGWSEVWSDLLILLGFNIVLAGAGIMTLRRKFS